MNGSAIFITHIPTNGDCLHGWGHRLRGLMERYQHIIRFGLFGHTHDESYSVIQAVSDSKNIGLNFIAPSVTTYTDKNPSFTLIEIDEEFMVPLNFKIYYYNIEKANAEGKISWEILHDVKTYYGFKDLRPDEMFKFAERVKADEKIALLYIWNKYRQTPATRPSRCDDLCRLQLFCDMTSTEYFQAQVCQGRPTYDWLGDPENAIMNFLVNPWIKKVGNGSEAPFIQSE